MTIARRLWLGFGILVALFAAVVLALILWLRQLDQSLHRMTAVAVPLAATAQEMDINALDIGVEVMRYLDTGDPAARVRLAKDEADSEDLKDKYDGLTRTPKHRDIGQRISGLFGEYIALGRSLMDQRDMLRALYPEAVSRIEAIRESISRGSVAGGRGIKLPATLATRVADVSVWFNRYLVSADPTHKQKLFDAAKDFETELGEFGRLRLTAKQKQGGNDLRERFTETWAKVKEAVLLHDVQLARIETFGEMRSQLDSILGHEIQVLTADELRAASKTTQDTMRRIRSAILFLLAAGLLVGLVTSAIVARGVLRGEETLRVTLTSIGDGVIATDRGGCVTLLNSVAQSLTGWTQEEAAGKSAEGIFRIVNEDTRAPIENPVERVLRAGAVVGLGNHTILIAKDGTERPIDDSAAPIRNDRGDVTGVVLIFRDVTERRRNEAEISRLLADEQQRRLSLRKVTEASLSMNSGLSAEGVLGIVTEEARHIIGTHQSCGRFRRDDQASWSMVRSLSDKYAAFRTIPVDPPNDALLALVWSSDRPVRLAPSEVQDHPVWRDHANTERTRQPPMRGWLAVPLIGRNNRKLGFIELSDKCTGDFSESDEALLMQLANIAVSAMENAFLYEDLSAADRRKDEFLATLAHELRNPLAPLRNALEIMRLKGDAASDHAREMMQRQVTQMVRLVDELIDVSRISRGKIDLQREVLDLAAVVENALETTRPIIEAAGHDLTVSLPAQHLYVEGDLTRLAQVLVNLLDNAAKYTPPRGHIWVSARQQEHEVVVSVRDNGIGIPADVLPRIFDMFTQVDRSLERSPTGLGIGLNLVRSLVEMHGGTVEAHSAGAGQGSEFIVGLPRAPTRPVEDRAQQPAASEPSEALALRILVVDDNRDAAESMTTLLKLWGNEVETAHDGPNAIKAATAFGPDAVLLDIGLPGLNGYEVARRIRAKDELKGVALIALTGWAQSEDRRVSHEAGFDHHMAKPVDLDALRHLLESLGPSRPKLTS